MGLRNRKQFLTTVSATGAALAFAAGGRASAAGADADASPAPSAAPSPAPTEKLPSASALAVAAAMRRFDPKLSDAEIERIARDIDDGAGLGTALNPKKKRLRNGDEPVTSFAVPSE
jgi:hypothetical protein